MARRPLQPDRDAAARVGNLLTAHARILTGGAGLSLAALTALGWLAAAGPVAAQPPAVEIVEDHVTSDATWGATSRVYVLDVEIEVLPGVTLTILPGTTIKGASGSGLLVRGVLRAVGTPDARIRFTSLHDDNIAGDTFEDGPTIPRSSDWGGIRFDGVSANSSELRYVEVWFAGEALSVGVVSCVNASPTLEECLLAGGKHGLTATSGAAPDIRATRIEGCSSAPLAISLDAHPTFDGLVFGSERDNGLDAIGILDSRLVDSATLGVRGTQIGGQLLPNVTYALLGSVSVEKDAVLTIQPGVVLKADAGARITVHGRLDALGNAQEPVVFTSVADDTFGSPDDTNRDGSMSAPFAGDWGGIAFADSSAGLLRHCVVRYGGGSGLIETHVAAQVQLENCLLAEGRTGLYQFASEPVSVIDSVVRNCDGPPVFLALPDRLVLTGTTFLANRVTALGLSTVPIREPTVLRSRDVAGFTAISYYVSGGMVANSSLTIDPGVTIKFEGSSAGISLRDELHATGVLFTSIHDDCSGSPNDTCSDGWMQGPCPADWGGLSFVWGPGERSTLQSCTFRFGGAGCQGVVRAEGPGPQIDGCLFEFNAIGFSSRGNGLPLAGKQGIRLPNIFYRNGRSAVVFIGGTLARDATLSGLVMGGTIEALVVLDRDLIVPYDVTLTIASRTKILAIDAGIVVRGALIADIPPEDADETGIGGGGDGGSTGGGGFGGEPVLYNGCRFVPGCDLDATACALGKQAKAAAEWKGIRIEQTSDDLVSLLRNYRIAGARRGVEVIHASPILSGVRITDCELEGIRIEGPSRPVIDGCEIARVGSAPVTLSLTANPTFADNDFHDNGYAGLGILGETLADDAIWAPREVSSGVWPPYVVLEDLQVAPGVTLRVQPGVVAKFLPGRGLAVNHALQAVGGVGWDQQIVFTSVADDFYGGRTPEVGIDPEDPEQRWSGITLMPSAQLGASRFERCAFRFAGSLEAGAAVRLTGRSSADFAQCTFARNGIGIDVEAIAQDPALASIAGTDFLGNERFAIRNTGMHSLAAEGNWWGDGSGPLDDSDDRDLGGLYNPGGAGDPVSDGVDYQPWLQIEPDHGLLGDVSFNGLIQAHDASLVLRHLVGAVTLSALGQSLGDVTCSGGLTALDAAEILRLVARASTTFPCAGGPLAAAPPERAALTLRPRLGQAGEWSLEWSGATPLRAAAFELLGNAAEIVAVAPGEAGRAAALHTRLDGAGTLHAALASPEGLASGELLRIRVQGSGPADGVPLRVLQAVVHDRDALDAVTITSEPDRAPAAPQLQVRAVPNPFNPATTVHFSLAGESGARVPARVVIHDVAGRLVRVLVDGVLEVGPHQIAWDGRDDGGAPAGSGVYVCRVIAGDQSVTRKLTLLR